MKKFLFFFLLLMGTVVSQAYDFSAVAPTGQTLYYNISGTTVTVTYPGSSINSSYSGYTAPTGDLEIPATVSYNGTTYSVTSIREYAFAWCSSLTSVTVPNSVTSIGEDAFYGVRMVFYCGEATGSPWGANQAGCFYEEGDFIYQDESKTVIVAYIGSGNVVTIPSSVTSIGNYAFYNCSSLTSVTIPNSVTSIGNHAFYECSSLTSVTIPNSVTSIGNYAFSRCSGLTSVTIPNSVTSIGVGAFDGCSGLTSVDIPNSVTSIGSSAFFYCTGLTSVTIPNSVTSIGFFTFLGCSGLTSVTIPNSVTSIESSAFDGCSGLTSVDIPNSVTSIEVYAFAGCSGLTSVTIPNSVTSLGVGAFDGCSGLTEIISLSRTAPLLGNDVFSGVDMSIPVTIPCGSQMSYLSRWSYFSNFVEVQGFSFEANSSNMTMGTVEVLTQPTCSNSQAVINAVPTSGYLFSHWSNGVTTNPYSFTLTQDTSLTAYFALPARDTVYVTVHDTTYIDIHDTTYVSVYDTTYVPVYDTTYVPVHDTTYVSVYDTTYVPVHDTTYIDIHDTTYVPVHDTTYVDVFIHDTSYVDVFIHDTTVVTVHDTVIEQLTYYTLSVVSGNNNRGLVAGNGTFPEGTEVEIAAIPIQGNMFVQWADGNTENPRLVTVNGNTSYVATFEANPVGVTEVEGVNFTIDTENGAIVVKDAPEMQIRIFDNLGRCLITNKGSELVRMFNMPATGAYMVQVGNYPAQKVVVVK